ncbi:MAG: NADH-quinone oxidoreductase subunit G [Nitrospirae bacterium]|nr:MAG: NADH-quinone oxidoreductase subunit G [Nitrospirota bacterium]
MPKLTIDGHEVEVEPGTTLIRAARQLGIEIPHYCYHPGLSIAGNCRMCLVEVEGMPKMAIACHTQAADGMVVHTDSEKCREYRAAIMEFLLVNHPLDCPVCDQAGECKLQDYYMEHGAAGSRVNENKVKKRAKAVQIGPNVMLDSERCILCSRCVRFCDEITGTHELGITERADHSEITLADGAWLDNPYATCVVDLCPVGALTDRDFRFKCRVWYLTAVDSVCTGCARGCNITIHVNRDRPYKAGGARVMRYKPRKNMHVNQWWMCDAGRYSYKQIDHDRLTEATVEDRAVPVEQALEATAEALRAAGPEVGILVAPTATNEEMYLARALFAEALGGRAAYLAPPMGEADDFLILADKSPNARGGAAILGEEVADPVAWATEHGLKAVVVVGEADLAGMRSSVDHLTVIATHPGKATEQAHVVLPGSVHAEVEGTFTNHEGRVQRIRVAVPPIAGAVETWRLLLELAERLGHPFDFQFEDDIFAALADHIEAFAGLSHENLGRLGAPLGSGAAQPAEAG